MPELLGYIANAFRQRGIHSMLLFGDAGSPANGFYERMGAVQLFTSNGAFHGGYGWRDLASLAKSCEVSTDN